MGIGWSLLWLSIGSFLSMVTYKFIDGYSTPGFTRPDTYDEDGNFVDHAGLVYLDWWPITMMLAIFCLWAGIWCWNQWHQDD